MRLGKILLATLVAGGVALGMVSCKKDKGIPEPKIEFFANNTEDEVKFPVVLSEKGVHVKVTTDEATELKEVKLAISVETSKGNKPNAVDAILTKTLGGKTTAGLKEAMFQIKDDPKGETNNKLEFAKKFEEYEKEGIKSIHLMIIAIDKNDGRAEKELKGNEKILWKKDGSTSVTPAGGTKFDNKKTGSLSHFYGAENGAFSFTLGEMKSDAVQANGNAVSFINISEQDVAFTNGFSSVAERKIKNAQKEEITYRGQGATFKLYDGTVEDGNEITLKEDVTKDFQGKNEVTNVTTGQVYIAKEGDVFYLMKITEVNSTAGSSEKNKGIIRFNYYKIKK